MAAVGVIALIDVVQAAVPPHLDEMPTVDRVLAIQGWDRIDTAARQVATFRQLGQMLATLSGGRHSRGELTVDERRLAKAYGDAAARVEAPILASFGVEGSHRLRAEEDWARRLGHYATDDAFRRALLERYFSRKWQASYRAVESQRKQAEPPPKPALAPTPPLRRAPVLLVTLVLIAIGGVSALVVVLMIRPVIRRRMSKEDALFVPVLEAIARKQGAGRFQGRFQRSRK